MVDKTDIVNRALQAFGSRTTVTASELANNTSNEAIQANLIYENTRDDLLRMAPWNCGTNFANLVYITSQPGTPENQSPGTQLWAKGQPAPPWAYEYQYPVDCLRALFIVPQFQTGFAGGVPITTAVTGGAAAFWQGPPIKFKVGIDQFFPVLTGACPNQGTGYVVGEVVTLAYGPNTSPPIGGPVKLRVTGIGGTGNILLLETVNQIAGSATPLGGSYFAASTETFVQGETTGVGTGATFQLTYGPKGDQRVILTNQEFALLCYMKQITDVNVMDTLFQTAFISALAGQLCYALTGDKALANMKLSEANNDIMEARKADGNEGLTINDVTPDWIRARGIAWPGWQQGPNQNFDWGGLWPVFS